MIEETVSLEEFKILNNKVQSMSESCAVCKATVNSDLRHLDDEIKQTKYDLSEIKQMVQKISEQVNGLTIKVSIVVSVIVAAVNYLVPLFLNK